MLQRRELSERTGKHGWIRTDIHDLAPRNHGDRLPILRVQLQFTAEELRGRNRTSREDDVPDWGAVHEDGLG